MSFPEQSSLRSYSQEDVQQILSIALAQQPDEDAALSYAQLLEIAEELHIPPTALKIAENRWLTQRGADQKRAEFDAHRLAKFQNKVGRYAIINSSLFALNWLTGLGVLWSLYIAIAWGMKLGLDAWKFYYRREGSDYEQSFQNWQRKQKIQKSITGLIDKLV
jgi:2TM domain